MPNSKDESPLLRKVGVKWPKSVCAILPAEHESMPNKTAPWLSQIVSDLVIVKAFNDSKLSEMPQPDLDLGLWIRFIRMWPHQFRAYVRKYLDYASPNCDSVDNAQASTVPTEAMIAPNSDLTCFQCTNSSGWPLQFSLARSRHVVNTAESSIKFVLELTGTLMGQVFVRSVVLILVVIGSRLSDTVERLDAEINNN